MRICIVGAKLFNTDRCTDMTKLMVVSFNSANMPKYIV